MQKFALCLGKNYARVVVTKPRRCKSTNREVTFLTRMHIALLLYYHTFFVAMYLAPSLSFITTLYLLYPCTVSPLVERFAFPKNLTRGERLRVICTVTEGDLPLQVEWWKDGLQIGGGHHDSSSAAGSVSIVKFASQGVQVRRIDEYTSLLAISFLETTHAGNYSCVASNSVASFSRSATLTIRGEFMILRAGHYSLNGVMGLIDFPAKSIYSFNFPFLENLCLYISRQMCNRVSKKAYAKVGKEVVVVVVLKVKFTPRELTQKFVVQKWRQDARARARLMQCVGTFPSSGTKSN